MSHKSDTVEVRNIVKSDTCVEVRDNIIEGVEREEKENSTLHHKRDWKELYNEDEESSTTNDKPQQELKPIIKSQPNFVFASWLCFMYGQKNLRKGSGVIDIAGGNGLLSFELTCRYGKFRADKNLSMFLYQLHFSLL